ncbi:MAG: hypothetical protein HY308_16980 [Gammaproteobacteria bacterium]|nr:hypothetical protein [Gammaproteobacteria bacterium]
MLTIIVVLKALMEIAALALAGQGVLYLLAGRGRETNVFYRILKTLTTPVMVLTRFITPGIVPDRMIGWASFCLIAGLWVALTLMKIRLVLLVPSV